MTTETSNKMRLQRDDDLSYETQIIWVCLVSVLIWLTPEDDFYNVCAKEPTEHKLSANTRQATSASRNSRLTSDYVFFSSCSPDESRTGRCTTPSIQMFLLFQLHFYKPNKGCRQQGTVESLTVEGMWWAIHDSLQTSPDIHVNHKLIPAWRTTLGDPVSAHSPHQ